MQLVRYEKDGNYWEIVYVSDIHEIIERTGKIGTLGKFTINVNYDKDAEKNIINKKIYNKIQDNWHAAKLSLSKTKLIDIRLEFYDLNGNLKYTKN